MRRRRNLRFVRPLVLAFVLLAIGSIALLWPRHHDPSKILIPNNSLRSELYQKMADEGRKFLSAGETTQSLKIDDIFSYKDGEIHPVLKPAEPPVRAMVLYLPQKFSNVIAESVRKTFGSRFSGIWYQNLEIYHFSLFHASHHQEPVPASETEIEAELAAAEQVARSCSPLRIQLERVVLTCTGAVIGCWQVLTGTDPQVLRERLRNTLPNAPKKQLYHPLILHTSFARVLPPTPSETNNNGMTTESLQRSIMDLNAELKNLEADVNELWFVEELDILALALNGRVKAHKFPLGNKI